VFGKNAAAKLYRHEEAEEMQKISQEGQVSQTPCGVEEVQEDVWLVPALKGPVDT
tara:strand:+ start:226 stop:390 length:165 start_codon:yes stop_codon:yes gene_type:complete